MSRVSKDGPRKERSHDFAFPRQDLPELCVSTPPRKFRGRRECRMLSRTRKALRAMGSKERTQVVQVGREHPAFPARWFMAYSALSPGSGRVSPRHSRTSSPASLTSASGGQDHAASPSARALLVKQDPRVHRSPLPTPVTVATPL